MMIIKKAGRNQTYKLNFTQVLQDLKIGVTHSKFPSLSKCMDPLVHIQAAQQLRQKKVQQTNFLVSSFFKNFEFTSTVYRTNSDLTELKLMLIIQNMKIN